MQQNGVGQNVEGLGTELWTTPNRGSTLFAVPDLFQDPDAGDDDREQNPQAQNSDRLPIQIHVKKKADEPCCQGAENIPYVNHARFLLR